MKLDINIDLLEAIIFWPHLRCRPYGLVTTHSFLYRKSRKLFNY